MDYLDMPKRPPRSKKANQPAELKTEKIAALVADIDDALGSARAFAMALELMGLGMRALEDDYSSALVTVTESVLKHLDSAKAACASILVEVEA
jgi:hypothetical protein